MPNKPPQPPPNKPTPPTGGPIKGPAPSKRVVGTSTNPIYGGGSTVMSSINSLTNPGNKGGPAVQPTHYGDPAPIKPPILTPPNRSTHPSRTPVSVSPFNIIGRSIFDLGNLLFGGGSSTPGANMMDKPVSRKDYGKKKVPYKNNNLGNIAKKDY
jgi:hypothetical protein